MLKLAPKLSHRLPLPFLFQKQGVAHDEVPDDCLEALGVRGDGVRVYHRYYHAGVSYFLGVPAISPDNAQDFRAGVLRVLQSLHQINTDALFLVAAANREDQHRVLARETAHCEPMREDIFPPVVIDPCREFGDVIHWRIGLKPGDLPKIVHRVRGMPRSPADAKYEKPPARIADLFQYFNHLLNGRAVKRVDNLLRLGEVLVYVGTIHDWRNLQLLIHLISNRVVRN